MKNIFIALLVTLSLFSCKNEDKNPPLSESNGKINNVSIIIDENLWNGEVGDSLRKKFAAPTDGLPQEEPIFNLNQYPTRIFDGLVKKSRNIILVQKSKSKTYSEKENTFAKPQKLFVIYGKNNSEIIDEIEKNASQIINSIKAGEILENQIRLNKSLINDKTIQDKFKVALNVGYGYKYDMVKEDFIWLRKEFSSGYNSILIYQVPISTIEKDTNTIANITAMRDLIGKKYIHGTLPNTWMITEEAYAPYLNIVTLDGRKTFETKGTWELKNDFMVGPFVNYAIKDAAKNRYLIIEGFTYNPSKAKRDLMFELEAIIKSVTFLK